MIESFELPPPGAFQSRATSNEEWAKDFADHVLSYRYDKGLVAPTTGVTKPVDRDSIKSVDDVVSMIEQMNKEMVVRRGGAAFEGNSVMTDTYRERRFSTLEAERGMRLAAQPGPDGRRVIGVDFDLDQPNAYAKASRALGVSPEDFDAIASGQKAITPEQGRKLFEYDVLDTEKYLDARFRESGRYLTEHQRIGLLTLAHANPGAVDRKMMEAISQGDPQRITEAILWGDGKGPTSQAEAERRMRAALLFAGPQDYKAMGLPDRPSQYNTERQNAMTARGIRNNNPGNIDFQEGVNWQGQTGTDGRFAIFKTPEDGIRAMGKLLVNYQKFYGLTTLPEIIGRYAPKSENDTNAYVNHVAKSIGVQPGDKIDLTNKAVLTKMVEAMIKMENGTVPYSSEQIATGISRVFS